MFDDLKQEITYGTNAISKWWDDYDNRFASWTIVILTAVVALLTYSGLFFGGRAAWHALNEETIITVVDGNPCLTAKGLVQSFAPAQCYDDNRPHTVPPRVDITEELAKQSTEVAAKRGVYDPPCVKDKLPGCTDKVYSKRLIEGLVDTVTFADDEKQINEDHLQPDYTEVKFAAKSDTEDAPNAEKFCGNMLHRFTPGRKIKMVINESKQSDYNGCYTIDVVLFTFGSDPYHATAKHSTGTND